MMFDNKICVRVQTGHYANHRISCVCAMHHQEEHKFIRRTLCGAPLSFHFLPFIHYFIIFTFSEWMCEESDGEGRIFCRTVFALGMICEKIMHNKRTRNGKRKPSTVKMDGCLAVFVSTCGAIYLFSLPNIFVCVWNYKRETGNLRSLQINSIPKMSKRSSLARQRWTHRSLSCHGRCADAEFEIGITCT